MKRKCYWIIVVVIVLIIGFIFLNTFYYMRTGPKPLDYCVKDSDCKCCDFAGRGNLLSSGKYKEEYQNICINRDLVVECANAESENAFCATHDCKCVNKKCSSVIK